MFKGLKNETGSASVLVMLIMISLITFGLLAMLLSNSDYKMSKKNAKWLNQQYEVESRAAVAEATLDQVLTRLSADPVSASNAQTLLKKAGQDLAAIKMSGYAWQWQPTTQLVICEVEPNAEGQAMTLGFKVWVVPEGNTYALVYDVVSWRATRQ